MYKVYAVRELSRKFNEQGLRTIALSGADSEETRAEAIERLTMDVQSDDDNYLDYIITVDIFSEGTDIVEVNQVIMLRPTEREMTTPLFLLRCVQLGLSMADLELLSIGLMEDTKENVVYLNVEEYLKKL